MKKILTVILAVLALNFLVAAAGAVWLVQSGRVDTTELSAMREMAFPSTQPATRPAIDPEAAATQPTLKLDELLARQAGQPATEQMAFIQRTFDAQMSLLDRRQREIEDLRRQVELARRQLENDRAALQIEQRTLDARTQEAQRLAEDQGFQDALSLYRAMPSRQVKDIFMTLEEPAVVNFLRAMEPRQAGRILREFRTPEELDRAQRVLESLRTADTTALATPATPQE